jgi:NADH dehydrogenase
VFGPLRLAGWFAWILWLSVHIFYLIGFRNRLMVFLQWAWAYVTRKRSARLITCEPAPDSCVQINSPEQKAKAVLV